MTSNECAKANRASPAEQAAEDADLKRLAMLLGPTRLVRPKCVGLEGLEGVSRVCVLWWG